MRSSGRALSLSLAACVALASHATAQDGPPASDGPSATSDRSPDRYDEVGYATWYGNELAGNRTASGAPFDPSAFTAAHRTLPLGSFVEVTSLDTGRTVLVLINDRGPFTQGLLIDLSQAAAKAIGVNGRKAVRIRRVTPAPADQRALKNGQAAPPILDTPPTLLLGLRAKLTGRPAAFASTQEPAPADRLRITATTPLKPSPGVKGSYYVQVAAFGSKARAAALAKSLGGNSAPFNNLWRVRTGPFADAKSAAQARDAVAARGYGDARVVRED